MVGLINEKCAVNFINHEINKKCANDLSIQLKVKTITKLKLKQINYVIEVFLVVLLLVVV